jgi:hypothetical protein
MIALCPIAEPYSPAKTRLSWLPSPIFDLFRLWDRRGGTASNSVLRAVGPGADEETRKLQLKFNMQSESAPFLRTLGTSIGSYGLPGKAVWSGIKVPLFLVAGDSDTLTPAEHVETITGWLTKSPVLEGKTPQKEDKTSTLPSTTADTTAAERVVQPTKPDADPPRMDSGTLIKDEQTSTKHSFSLKTTVFPAPAAHGLMYMNATVRILSGMIENFLADHIDKRLGRPWQLHHLTTSGKWDVKNLEKWDKIDACSVPIGGIFRAMKTMREVDEKHCPKEFVKNFGFKALPDGVKVVLDISHETPVYHPEGLEEAGVRYVKFPTVSKEKPRPEEVDEFIKIVDGLRNDKELKLKETDAEGKHPTIGVHCHYG